MPHPKKDLPQPTLRSSLKQARLRGPTAVAMLCPADVVHPGNAAHAHGVGYPVFAGCFAAADTWDRPARYPSRNGGHCRAVWMRVSIHTMPPLIS